MALCRPGTPSRSGGAMGDPPPKAPPPPPPKRVWRALRTGVWQAGHPPPPPPQGRGLLGALPQPRPTPHSHPPTSENISSGKKKNSLEGPETGRRFQVRKLFGL